MNHDLPLFALCGWEGCWFGGSQKTCLINSKNAFGRKAQEHMTKTKNPVFRDKNTFFPVQQTLFYVVVTALSVMISTNGCKQPTVGTQKEQTESTGGTISFTETEVKHAKGFSIEYTGDHKILKIVNHFGSRTDTLAYALVQRGRSAPDGFEKSHVIEIPVRNVVGMSSLQIAMADFLNSSEVITGLASFKYVSSSKLRERIKQGKVQEVGEEGTINSEAIIAMGPDLVMAMGNPSASFSRYQTLIDAGIPVILVSEWLEHTPLGRAEWVKLMAALLNKEELVNKKFAAIEAEYKRLAEIGRSAPVKPSIIVGMPYKGSWFVPDGTSFMTCFFKDAGASYAWYNTKGTGSMGMSFESVAPIALKADYWINCGTADTKADIASRDQRYTYFRPYKNNTIYNFNKKVNDLGSNDYWESGVVNPHLVLSDLIKILHPELLPAHSLVYYKQIL